MCTHESEQGRCMFLVLYRRMCLSRFMLGFFLTIGNDLHGCYSIPVIS